MKIRNLSRSIFQKDHFSTFIGLIIGLLSVPILLTAVYEPQKLTSLAMVTSEGVGSFAPVTNTSPATNFKPSSPAAKEEKGESGRPENECQADQDCGTDYLCRYRGGARRCVPRTTPSGSKSTSGGGKPYYMPALPEGRPMPTPTLNPTGLKINEIMNDAIIKCTKLFKGTNQGYLNLQCVFEYVIKRALEIPLPEVP